jgi:GrpB-like predicted nucleotidyltransferase (UPF0157 family)
MSDDELKRVTCEAEGVRREANLGLKANLNLLVAYDPLWPAAFEDEKVRLAKALRPVAKGIEHYGSTAVPGLCAKPILDIMVGISPLSEWERCKPVAGGSWAMTTPKVQVFQGITFSDAGATGRSAPTWCMSWSTRRSRGAAALPSAMR